MLPFLLIGLAEELSTFGCIVLKYTVYVYIVIRYITAQPNMLKKLTPPSPFQIRAARKAAQLTQAQAAEVVYSPSYRTWQDWERGETPMPIGLWELFMLKTGQMLLAVSEEAPRKEPQRLRA